MANQLKVSEVMTVKPYVIESGYSVSDAQSMIDLQKIKQMSVVKEGKLIGLVPHPENSFTSALRSALADRRGGTTIT
jgi:signal-transduction protein with cAMP-binding, CBS, and nucleotidyltransferase domain